MTPHLKKIIEANSKYFHLMKLNIISREENKLYRSRVNALLMKLKIAYYENLFQPLRQNMKKKLGSDQKVN